MTFKKFTGKIHLWLGLFSGIVVFVVAITGAILVFEHEIMKISGAPFVHKNPQRAVEMHGSPLLKPSALTQKFFEKYPGAVLWGIGYHRGYSSNIWGYKAGEEGGDLELILNPFNGHETPPKTDLIIPAIHPTEKFFEFILEGHLHLWISQPAGKMIVDFSTLFFLIMLISGIILWWPKNKAARKQRFKFQWKPSTQWKRKNYDLHNVLGFYMSWVAVFISVTGLVMAFDWFGKGWYFLLAAGGTPTTEIIKPPQFLAANISEAADKIWQEHFQNDPDFDGWMEIYYPEGEGGIMFRKQYSSGDMDEEVLNPYTLKKIDSENKVADAVLRNNYSIHVGEIGGLPTKFLAFFASLIAASLPVTGFYIWWGRRRKTVKNNRIKPAKL